MEKIKLYMDFLSPQCRGVYLFMSANQIPVDIKPVNISKSEHLENVFTKSFPLQILPTIDDNGFCLHESIAILRYLATKYRSVIGQEWYPDVIDVRTKQDEYLCWHHHNTRLICSNIFYLNMGTKIKWREPIFETTLSEAEWLLYDLLEKIESYFLQDKSYIGGSHPSIADILCFCELDQLQVVGVDASVISDRCPSLGAWLQRMEYRLEPDLQVANKYLIKLKDRIKSL